MVEANQGKKVTTAEFSAKFRSKYEIYRFLTIDAMAYLPPPECVTMYYLKDLVRGVKKFVKSENAKNLHVPSYKGLNIETILDKGRTYPAVMQHLPDERDISRLPRQWIINLIYSLNGNSFRTFVQDAIASRNTDLAEKNDLMIDLDPEIAAAFKSSVNISTHKGRGVHLLKPGSKRRRTAVEMEAQLDFEEAANIDNNSSKKKLEDAHSHLMMMERQLEDQQAQLDASKHAVVMINQLVDEGVVQMDKINVPNIIRMRQPGDDIGMDGQQ